MVRRREFGDADRPATPTAGSDDVAKLLEDVHQLRLTLAADLAAAAGAMEANEPGVARDIVAGDRHELLRIADTTNQRRPAPPPARRPRPRRALLALPAVPLIGALAISGAAALGHVSGTHHDSPAPAAHTAVAAQDPATEIQQTAASTLHQLEQVVSQHPRGAQVVEVAAHLHRQLTAILATSPNSPRRLSEVRRLLAVEQRLLETHHGQATAIALAASRHIAHLLGVRHVVSAVPTPSTTPTPATTAHPTAPAAPTRNATTKPTTTKSQSPKPQTSTTAPADPLSPKPAPTRSAHRLHSHHHHPKNPLLGSGLLNRNS